MPLYPSLEDLMADQMITAQFESLQQSNLNQSNASKPSAPPASLNTAPYPVLSQPLKPELAGIYYPNLNDYMGLDLNSEEIKMISQSIAERPSRALSLQSNNQMVAPISGQSLGLQHANITHGLREVTLCKDEKGKIGLRVKAMNQGIFVVLVIAGSPASMVRLRFGDQILQINDKNVAGYTMEKVHEIFRNAGNNFIKVIVRDRPFERTITLHKDSNNQTGFGFKNGKINVIVKDSSAARNGLLVDHNLLEVNGQNVVGLPDDAIRAMIAGYGNVITLTVMPSQIYEHMIKSMAPSLIKKFMDHSSAYDL